MGIHMKSARTLQISPYNRVVYGSYGKADPWILLRQLSYLKRTPVELVIGETHGERIIPLIFVRNTMHPAKSPYGK